MATYTDLSKAVGGDLLVRIKVYAIGSLPAASDDLLGALAVVTGTAHATKTTQLCVCLGATQGWVYAEDGVTAPS